MFNVRHEFAGTLFRTLKHMSDAIAGEWISGMGSHGLELQREFFDEATDEELADEAIEGWDLRGEWAEKRDFERADLIAAFSRLRDPTHPRWSDDL